MFIFRDSVRRRLFRRLPRAAGTNLVYMMISIVAAGALFAAFVWQFGSLAEEAKNAARLGDIAAITDLFKKGWKPNQEVDSYNNSMAHIAARYCKVQVFRVLQLAGARLDRPNAYPYNTPLCIFDECCTKAEATALEQATGMQVTGITPQCRRNGRNWVKDALASECANVLGHSCDEDVVVCRSSWLALSGVAAPKFHR
jgi:hypothetical protein